jgi:hypothetical protein
MKRIFLLFVVSCMTLKAGKHEALARKDAREERKWKQTEKIKNAYTKGWDGSLGTLETERRQAEKLWRQNVQDERVVGENPSCAQLCCGILVGLTTAVAYATLIMHQYDE